MYSMCCPIRSSVCGGSMGISQGLLASGIDLIAIYQGVDPHTVLKVSAIATAGISFVFSCAYFNRFPNHETLNKSENIDLEEANSEADRITKLLITKGEVMATASISALVATTLSSAFVILGFNIL